MVEQEFDSILAQYEERNRESREAPDSTEDPDAENFNKDPELDDEQKQEFRDIAERRVRLGLLLAEIGRQNDIQIGQEEINRAMMEEARKYPGQEQKVLEFYKDNPQALESVSAPLYEEKVIDFILELAKVDDKKVTVKEFMEILEKDNAEEQKKEKVSKKSPGKGTKGKKNVPSKKQSTKKSESSTKWNQTDPHIKNLVAR